MKRCVLSLKFKRHHPLRCLQWLFILLRLLLKDEEKNVQRSYFHRGRGCGRAVPSIVARNSNNSTKEQLTTTSQSPRTLCQIHNRVSHTALDCYHCMDYSSQGLHPTTKLVAMAASKQFNGTWFTDTRATNHITNNLANISIQLDYQGGEHIAIVDGTRLPITHTGSSFLKTSSHSFHLNDILYVPYMSTKSILVNQFCKNYNYYLTFIYSEFFFKDNLTRMTLFQGHSEDGLYPLQINRQNNLSRKIFSIALLGACVPSNIWHV